MDPFLARTRLRAVPGLPVPLLKSLVSWMIGLCSVAVFFGRAVSDPGSGSRAFRSPEHAAASRYAEVGKTWFYDPPGTFRLLDTETGEVMHGTIPGELRFDQFSCSPWRDGQGQYHLVGRWINVKGVEHDSLSEPVGLARYAFPEGRLLERIGLEVTPIGRPCWFPDRSERVVFSGGDTQIYVYDFSTARGGGGRDRAPAPRMLRWQVDGVATRRVVHTDLCWPSDPALRGRLLVAMEHPAVNSRTVRSLRLWWLELSADGTEIRPIEPVIVSDGRGPAPPRDEERFPSIGTSPGRGLHLAYLARDHGRTPWELWLMPVVPDGSNRPPRVPASAGRRLAEGCAPLLPVFSGDGRWVYAWLSEGTGICLKRFAVDGDPAVPEH
jgi:hypothetical protein